MLLLRLSRLCCNVCWTVSTPWIVAQVWLLAQHAPAFNRSFWQDVTVQLRVTLSRLFEACANAAGMHVLPTVKLSMNSEMHDDRVHCQ